VPVIESNPRFGVDIHPRNIVEVGGHSLFQRRRVGIYFTIVRECWGISEFLPLCGVPHNGSYEA
jgi:hypothetical protein